MNPHNMTYADWKRAEREWLIRKELEHMEGPAQMTRVQRVLVGLIAALVTACAACQIWLTLGR